MFEFIQCTSVDILDRPLKKEIAGGYCRSNFGYSKQGKVCHRSYTVGCDIYRFTTNEQIHVTCSQDN